MIEVSSFCGCWGFLGGGLVLGFGGGWFFWVFFWLLLLLVLLLRLLESGIVRSCNPEGGRGSSLVTYAF